MSANLVTNNSILIRIALAVYNFITARLNSSKNSDSALIVVSESTCELQALLAQYIVLAGEKHKVMKESHANQSDIEAQYNHFRSLELYLNETIESAFGIAHKSLLKYYQDRAKYPPRIIVKAPFNNNEIVDLFRKEQSSYSKFEAHENTAFETIKTNGKYYLCNNIPKAIKDDAYINKRINTSSVSKNYKLPPFFKNYFYKFVGQPERDMSWEAFWDQGNNTKRPLTESCYKSTLVIPMTLVNAELKAEFKNYILGESYYENGNKYEKLMFAFLCVDHRHTDYFNNNEDIKIGYILADLLSLFLVTRLMYTSKSKTFNDIKRLKENNLS